MDRLKTKKKLYAGLGDYNRQLRAQQLGEKYGRKKHDTGNEALDAVAASQDEAADSIQAPSFDFAAAVGDVGVDAEKWQTENESALAEIAEDEEMEKWTRKQTGG